MRWLYSLFICLLAPFVLTMLLWKERKEGREAWQAFLQRCGLRLSTPRGEKHIWFHCASVGEVTVASTVIEAIYEANPSVCILVTTTTITGAKRARQLLGDRVTHCFLCLDVPFVVKKFSAHWQPSALIITEVELWPNVIHRCWQKKCPVILINARLSERSAHRYTKIASLTRPMFNKITVIGAQATNDIKHYRYVGVAEERIRFNGNIKFEQAISMTRRGGGSSSSNNSTSSRFIILGASTHAPEEELMLGAFKRIRREKSNLQLVLVPRYPQRASEVLRLIEGMGLTAMTSSSQRGMLSSREDIIIVDEMGRLADAYAVADIAFVGGSIATRGGHNALEAAVHAVPVAMGPSRYNNAQICESLTDAGAMQLVTDENSLVACLMKWTNDNARRAADGRAGRAVVESNLGALEATILMIRDVMHGDSAD